MKYELFPLHNDRGAVDFRPIPGHPAFNGWETKPYQLPHDAQVRRIS
jgi:hypothetical protein